MNEQLSVVRIEVVTDSGIFSDDLTKRCCVEGKQKGTTTFIVIITEVVNKKNLLNC